MVKPRKDDVEYRNIRLKIETYNRLEKILIHFMERTGNPKLSLDSGINLLMDELDSLSEHSQKMMDDQLQMMADERQRIQEQQEAINKLAIVVKQLSQEIEGTKTTSVRLAEKLGIDLSSLEKKKA